MTDSLGKYEDQRPLANTCAGLTLLNSESVLARSKWNNVLGNIFS